MKPKPTTYTFKVKEPYQGNWLEFELTLTPDCKPRLTNLNSHETIILTKRTS